MQIIIPALIASCGIVFVVACALKLFQIGSSFSQVLRNVSAPAAVIISAIAVFLMAPSLVIAKIGSWQYFLTLGLTVFAMIGYGMLSSKVVSPSKNLTKKELKNFLIPFGPALAFDIIGGILVGLCIGGVALFGSDLCYFCATALALFLIAEKDALVQRYSDNWLKKKILTDIIASLVVIPIAAVLLMWGAMQVPNVAAYFTAIGLGYLLYRAAFQGYFIAKTYKK